MSAVVLGSTAAPPDEVTEARERLRAWMAASDGASVRETTVSIFGLPLNPRDKAAVSALLAGDRVDATRLEAISRWLSAAERAELPEQLGEPHADPSWPRVQFVTPECVEAISQTLGRHTSGAAEDAQRRKARMLAVVLEEVLRHQVGVLAAEQRVTANPGPPDLEPDDEDASLVPPARAASLAELRARAVSRGVRVAMPMAITSLTDVESAALVPFAPPTAAPAAAVLSTARPLSFAPPANLPPLCGWALEAPTQAEAAEPIAVPCAERPFRAGHPLSVKTARVLWRCPRATCYDGRWMCVCAPTTHARAGAGAGAARTSARLFGLQRKRETVLHHLEVDLHVPVGLPVATRSQLAAEPAAAPAPAVAELAAAEPAATCDDVPAELQSQRAEAAAGLFALATTHPRAPPQPQLPPPSARPARGLRARVRITQQGHLCGREGVVEKLVHGGNVRVRLDSENCGELVTVATKHVCALRVPRARPGEPRARPFVVAAHAAHAAQAVATPLVQLRDGSWAPLALYPPELGAYVRELLALPPPGQGAPRVRRPPPRPPPPRAARAPLACGECAGCAVVCGECAMLSPPAAERRKRRKRVAPSGDSMAAESPPRPPAPRELCEARCCERPSRASAAVDACCWAADCEEAACWAAGVDWELVPYWCARHAPLGAVCCAMPEASARATMLVLP